MSCFRGCSFYQSISCVNAVSVCCGCCSIVEQRDVLVFASFVNAFSKQHPVWKETLINLNGNISTSRPSALYAPLVEPCRGFGEGTEKCGKCTDKFYSGGKRDNTL